jgi:Tfp pilus assembly protein PilE
VSKGSTLAEIMVVCALIAVLSFAIAVPAYRSYALARASTNAASVLASDVGLLSRSAQNARLDQGASLVVTSLDPFSYQGWIGRPAQLDPNSALSDLVVQRTFPGVALTAGPIDTSTPLLFANNGSAQYFAHGVLASQHQIVRFVLESTAGHRTTSVGVDLFTGAISVGP